MNTSVKMIEDFMWTVQKQEGWNAQTPSRTHPRRKNARGTQP